MSENAGEKGEIQDIAVFVVLAFLVFAGIVATFVAASSSGGVRGPVEPHCRVVMVPVSGGVIPICVPNGSEGVK